MWNSYAICVLNIAPSSSLISDDPPSHFIPFDPRTDLLRETRLVRLRDLDLDELRHDVCPLGRRPRDPEGRLESRPAIGGLRRMNTARDGGVARAGEEHLLTDDSQRLQSGDRGDTSCDGAGGNTWIRYNNGLICVRKCAICGLIWHKVVDRYCWSECDVFSI